MRFVDLLRATVILSAGAATTLAVATVLAAGTRSDDDLVFVSAAWWCVAGVIGGLLGRRGQVNPAIGRLLADARVATMMPEHRPAAIVLNRLWPLLLCTVVATALAFLAPQIAAIATGFAIIWALSWRRQDSAVQAVEERDGVTFYVEAASPIRPLRLVRTPGFRREVPSLNGSGNASG